MATGDAELIGNTGAKSYGDMWTCEGGGTLFDKRVNPSDSTDTMCGKVLDKLNEFWANNKIYKGDSTIADEKDKEHEGATPHSREFMHIDEDYLHNSTPQNLATLLVHEGIHAAGYPDHKGEQGPVYNTQPYNRASQCVSTP